MNILNSKISNALLLLTFTACLTGCTKDKEPLLPTVPILTTKAASSITQTTATSGGNITSDGGTFLSAFGVCWSTSKNPTPIDCNTSDGGKMDNFTSTITGLFANTTYYVRAYATNSVGTSYGNEISFTTQQGSGGIVTDIDGNVYHTVIIGTQVWMAENLKTTKYNDGTTIPMITDNTEWNNSVTPGYCWYNNNETGFKATYGALYNWYTVNTGKLCPSGWHVPTDTEWTTLTDRLTNNGYGYQGSGNDVSKSLASTSVWTFHGTAGTVGNDPTSNNSSGFAALPGGYNVLGMFGNFQHIGFWWTASASATTTSRGTIYAWYRTIEYNGSTVNRYNWEKNSGYSVRCVRDL